MVYASQYFYTDRSKAVLLLWFLTVTCSCCPCLYFSSAIMLVTYFVNFRYLNDHQFGKDLFIRFTLSAFRKLPSVYVFSYFPFHFEGRMWDLIVSVPDHCLSFYFTRVMCQKDSDRMANSEVLDQSDCFIRSKRSSLI